MLQNVLKFVSIIKKMDERQISRVYANLSIDNPNITYEMVRERAMVRKNLDSERFWNSEQSWNYERIVSFGKLVLKCKIVRNVHDFQSGLRVYSLNPEDLCWNQLVHRTISECNCKKYSYVNKETPEMKAVFRSDAQEVIEYAQVLVQQVRG